MEIVHAKNITKSFGSKVAVNDLTFNLKEGETLGLLGPNGAGKTTTIDLLLNLKGLERGSVKLFGVDSKSYDSKIYNKIGVQFQASFYPEYITVDEVCRMTSSLYEGKIEYDTYLKDFQLADKKDQLVKTLSGGEKQKLAVLLALLHNPKLIFLDELTTGLDPQARREVWKILTKLKKQGVSILLTSHYMDEVENLCDRIIVLKKGKIVFEGTTSELVNNTKQKNLEEAYLDLIEEGNNE